MTIVISNQEHSNKEHEKYEYEDTSKLPMKYFAMAINSHCTNNNKSCLINQYNDERSNVLLKIQKIQDIWFCDTAEVLITIKYQYWLMKDKKC